MSIVPYELVLPNIDKSYILWLLACLTHTFIVWMCLLTTGNFLSTSDWRASLRACMLLT